MRIKKRNITIVLLTAVILFGLLFRLDSPQEIYTALRKANLFWMLSAVLCMVMYWLLEAYSLQVICNGLGQRLGFRECFRVTMVGQLFNCVTPFSSGGQPVQVYCLKQNGMSIGHASSILLAKFIIYQGILTVYSLIVMVYKLPFFLKNVPGFGYIAIAGFLVNMLVVTFLLCVGFYHTFVKRSLLYLAEKLYKFHILSDLEQSKQRICKELDTFYHDFKEIKKQKQILVFPALLIIVQLTFFFIIPYFLCISLFKMEVSSFTVLCASSFVQMAASFIPLPGGAGGAEGGFYLFFKTFLPDKGAVLLVIMLWRMITFYLPIFTGLFFTNQIRPHKKPLKNDT